MIVRRELRGLAKRIPKQTRTGETKVRMIACPTCHAAIGEYCVTENGKRTTHIYRRRMAIRNGF